MIKKLFYIILIIVLIGAVGGIIYDKTSINKEIALEYEFVGQQEEVDTPKSPETEEITVIPVEDIDGITPEEAEKLCVSVFGEKDKETGFLFSFGVSGAVERNNKQYYVIRASWLVNNSHMSYIGDFFVAADGSEVYTGIAKPPEEYIFDSLVWTALT